MLNIEWQVNTGLDVVDANDGLLSLREAMMQASAGDIISFADDLQVVLEGSLLLDKNITIDGTGKQVSISSESAPIFEMSTARVTLKNLSLSSLFDGEKAGIITVAPAQSLLLYNVSDAESTSVLNWAVSADKTGEKQAGNIKLYESSSIHNVMVEAGNNKLIASADTASIIRNATVFGVTGRSSGDIELNAVGYNLKADKNGDIYLRSTAKAYNTIVREDGAVLASDGALMDGLYIEYMGAVKLDVGVKLAGSITVAGAVFGTSTASLLDGEASLTFDISNWSPDKSFTFSFYEGARETVSLVEDLRAFQGAVEYNIHTSSAQSLGKYNLAGNAQSFTGSITLESNKVALGEFIVSNGSVEQGEILSGTKKYVLSLDNGMLALSVADAGSVITIHAKDNFDQSAYFGEYRYAAEGNNAGYYVKADGSQRFKGTLSVSADIVSNAFLPYCDHYLYATEMETRNSDGTYFRRDDFVFATENDINAIALVGTKWTSYSSGTANWARVSFEKGEGEDNNNEEPAGGGEQPDLKAGSVITIHAKDSFDQSAYFGEYRYVAEGNNAGYYVKADGSQRFKATLSVSAYIVSDAFLPYCDQYLYATEMETRNSNGTYFRRDDFVFATDNDINTIAFVGTKWTSNSGGPSKWARVSFENGEGNNDDPAGSITQPELIVDYSVFSQTITITKTAGFDCTEYFGEYSLVTSGENAGYYVSSDGKHRFAVQLSLSSDICSYNYEKVWSEYVYASEMETKYGNLFYGRDDFVFSTSASLQNSDGNGKYALGTKNTSQGDYHSKHAGVIFGSAEPTTPEEETPFNGDNLPKYVYVSNTAGFDCTCYIGKYTLNTVGANAGYYVHENGTQRFRATLSVSSDICSDAFSGFFGQYAFAAEMESSHGGIFCGRDDYLFCTGDSVSDAKYVGTKITIKPNGAFTWATVSIDENEIVGENDGIETPAAPIEEIDYSKLPSTIVVNDVNGFDCKCYLGTYTLFTQGTNAGYYLHSSGTQRFKAVASLSSDICSSAFSSFFDVYKYAFEMESGYNGVFYGRDDYVFSSLPDLGEAFAAGDLKLGTKSTIQQNAAPNWADVTLTESSSSPSVDDLEDLPLTLTVNPHEGFDYPEYYGTYILTLEGQNAGYYVKVDGTHRFSATLSVSSAICSSTFQEQCGKYLFASEMETAFNGGGFYKRDDFIFCTENTIATAEYLGTKNTIGANGQCDWAEVSKGVAEIEEPDDSGLTPSALTGLLISPVFADTDIAYVRYSFDDDSTWHEYQIGAGIAMETNRSISFRIYNRGGFYKESSFTFDQNNDASKLQWVSVGSSEYILEVSQDSFEHSFSMKVPYNYVDNLALPGNYEWRMLDQNGIGIMLKVCADEEDEVKAVKAENADAVSILWSRPSDIWETVYYASHAGSFNGQEYDSWLNERVSVSGMNRIIDIFEGADSDGALNVDKHAILLLTDDGNGDAIFVDDIYSSLPSGFDVQARIARIDEIQAGSGNDVVDLTSERFEYIGTGLTIRGGDGNDTIWANKGNNWLFGDAGNDRLVGAAGNDVIVGGIGNDRMLGGGGNDIFTFCGNWGADEVEQIAGGSVALWFASGDESKWNAETLTYTDGDNSVTVKGVASVELKFGDDGSDKYDELLSAGAFTEFTSQKIFEESGKGLLA